MKLATIISFLCVNVFAVVLGPITIDLPKGVLMHQEAKSDDTLILGLKTPDNGYVTLYAMPKSDSFSPEKMFFNDVEILNAPLRRTMGALDWWIGETMRQLPNLETTFSTVFYRTEGNWLVLGTSHHAERMFATQNALDILSNVSRHRSLTGPEYLGKKYYLGWGAAGFGDPNMMHNEVKFDVNHTHDIFTKEIGGSYIGTSLIGTSVVTRTAILKAWQSIGSKMTDKDMFVQYSSGHGSQSGLGVGVSYNEIRDNALKYPAQEIVVFIMSCYSGGLVDAFNAKKSVWADWASKGRTLMVMSSSKVTESSSTGPGIDPDEPGGPNGSAGSAFGYALWKALIGYGDGFVDGVKDGFLSLGEIEKYTKSKTLEVGDHNPVTTGVYLDGLIMNKVPPKEFVDRYDVELTEKELMDQLQLLDAMYRVTPQ